MIRNDQAGQPCERLLPLSGGTKVWKGSDERKKQARNVLVLYLTNIWACGKRVTHAPRAMDGRESSAEDRPRKSRLVAKPTCHLVTLIPSWALPASLSPQASPQNHVRAICEHLRFLRSRVMDVTTANKRLRRKQICQSTFTIDADNSTTALMAQADLFFPGTGIPAIFTLTEKSVLLVVK